MGAAATGTFRVTEQKSFYISAFRNCIRKARQDADIIVCYLVMFLALGLVEPRGLSGLIVTTTSFIQWESVGLDTELIVTDF